MALWHCHSLKKPLFPSNLKSYFILEPADLRYRGKEAVNWVCFGVVSLVYLCRLIFCDCTSVNLCGFAVNIEEFLAIMMGDTWLHQCRHHVAQLWYHYGWSVIFSGCCLRQRHCSNIVINGVSPAISQSSQMSSLHSPSMCCIIYLNRQLLCGQGIKFAAIVCDLLYSDILIQMVRSNTCSIRVVKIWGGLNYNVILI